MHIERIKPGPGQESVWDYPRPPLVQRTDRHVEVVFGGRLIADTRRAHRVLKTSHPPVYYVPLDDVVPGVLSRGDRTTYREFTGEARFHHVRVGEHSASDAAWMLDPPSPGYAELGGHVAFFPEAMDECRLDGEVVRPQPGGYYGGWITSDIVGPFKGDPGVRD